MIAKQYLMYYFTSQLFLHLSTQLHNFYLFMAGICTHNRFHTGCLRTGIEELG